MNETLSRALDRQGQECGSAPFLTQVESGETLSFAETDMRAMRMAGVLQAVGVGNTDIVATMLPNGIDSAVAWFGCGRLGAIEAPIGMAYKGVLLRHLLDLCEARVLIIDSSVVDVVSDVLLESTSIEHLFIAGGDTLPQSLADFRGVVRSLGAAMAEASLPSDLPELDMSDVACLLFTSGTTGRSRGVLCTYAQEFEGIVAAPPMLGPADGIYSTSPPNHVGQKLLLYKALVFGCRFVMRGTFSVTEFWRDIAVHGCTTTLMLGGAASYLLKQPDSPLDSVTPLKSTVMIPLHPQVKEFRRRFGIAVHSFYNMTEICPVTALTDAEIRDHRSCGRVRPGFDWRLVDGLDREVPIGAQGELVLRPRNPWLFSRGYFGDDAKTVEAWRNLWFHTGDNFVADKDGYLYFIDRAKDVVRRRGENISSSELESIASQHEYVLEAAVVGVPSEHTEEDIKLVVVTADKFRDPQALFDHLRKHAPQFMLPRFIEFVDELPKTPTLKVRKSDLRRAVSHGELFDLSRPGSSA